MQQESGVRSASRSTTLRAGCGISLALVLGAAAASAKPAPKSQSAPPVESVTVTGGSTKAVNDFVQSVSTPTHVIGKVARWEVPICPAAVGAPDKDIALVMQRVKDVAVQAGVRVSTNPDRKSTRLNSSH